jgi:hypothetical protein
MNTNRLSISSRLSLRKERNARSLGLLENTWQYLRDVYWPLRACVLCAR